MQNIIFKRNSKRMDHLLDFDLIIINNVQHSKNINVKTGKIDYTAMYSGF